MKKYFLFIASLYSLSSVAQERDVATINYSISKLKYNDTLANAKQLDIKFRLPLFKKNKNTFGATIGYKNVALHNFPENYTQNLHGFMLQVAWLHKISGSTSIALFAQAGLFTDMKDIDGNDFRYAAGFRYRVNHSDKLSTGWGLAYSRQFFGNQVIPFIDVDYKPNDKWSITGQFPIKPKIFYHFNKKISAGMEINGDAASYRLSASEKNNQFLQINQWATLAKLEYQFARSWQFNFGIGVSVKQAYKLYHDASTTRWTIITIPLGDKPAPVQQIDSKGLNMQLGISFNPFTNR